MASTKRLVAGEVERGAPFVSLRQIDRGACARDVRVRATYGIGRTCNESLSGGDATPGARGDHLLLRFGLCGLRPCLRELGLRLLQSRRIVGVVDLGDQIALLDPVVVLRRNRDDETGHPHGNRDDIPFDLGVVGRL